VRGDKSFTQRESKPSRFPSDPLFAHGNRVTDRILRAQVNRDKWEVWSTEGGTSGVRLKCSIQGETAANSTYLGIRRNSAEPNRSRTIACSTSTANHASSQSFSFGRHFIALTLRDPSPGMGLQERTRERAKGDGRLSASMRGNAPPGRSLPARSGQTLGRMPDIHSVLHRAA